MVVGFLCLVCVCVVVVLFLLLLLFFGGRGGEFIYMGRTVRKSKKGMFDVEFIYSYMDIRRLVRKGQLVLNSFKWI